MEEIVGSNGLTLPITVKVDDFHVINSGTVHIQEGQVLSLKISVLTFKLCFPNTEDGKVAINVEPSLEDKKTLTLKFCNFKSATGQGTSKPLNIGRVDGDQIYLSVFIWTPDDKANFRVVSYEILRSAK